MRKWCEEGLSILPKGEQWRGPEGGRQPGTELGEPVVEVAAGPLVPEVRGEPAQLTLAGPRHRQMAYSVVGGGRTLQPQNDILV